MFFCLQCFVTATVLLTRTTFVQSSRPLLCKECNLLLNFGEAQHPRVPQLSAGNDSACSKACLVILNKEENTSNSQMSTSFPCAWKITQNPKNNGNPPWIQGSRRPKFSDCKVQQWANCPSYFTGRGRTVGEEQPKLYRNIASPWRGGQCRWRTEKGEKSKENSNIPVSSIYLSNISASPICLFVCLVTGFLRQDLTM